MIVKGVFNVRFNSFENCNKVLDDFIFMFDKKFVVVKFQSADLDIMNMNVNIIQIWVRLMELDFKYWRQNILMKLGIMLGKSVKTDRVMTMKKVFQYVRILIEVDIEEEMVMIISFENEWGGI